MPGPLAGVRVIDLTAVLLGPFATQHLADMGADVIKVEPPEGDLLRLSGGSMGTDKNMGPIYMAANRNKRSLCLDLKKPRAVEILKGMIKGADLFIHNSRPAAIERLQAAGCLRVTVVPVFLGQGGHVRRDVPRLVDEARARHPDLQLALAPSIGEEAQVLDAIAGLRDIAVRITGHELAHLAE